MYVLYKLGDWDFFIISHRFENYSKTTDTPLAFWTLGEIKNSAHGKVKRED